MPTLTVDANVHDALWARFVAPLLDGTHGFVRQVSLTGVDDPVALFPTRGEARRLRGDLPVGSDFSLAELMANDVVTEQRPVSVGQYL